jgi:oligopeptide transport system ATP-binding protein
MVAPSDPLLIVQAVTKRFSVRRSLFGRGSAAFVHALDGVSLSVDKGQAFGIVGESGSGKSTLARTILRLHEPDSGKVIFDRRDISHLSETALRPIRRDLQMIFQDTKSSLNPRLSTRQILAEPLVTHGLPHDRQSILRLLSMVRLDDSHIDRFPHQMSGGQRQRIGIARALALSPKLIVADEPVSALDVSIQAQILNLMKELQKRLALTIVLISHDVGVVGYFCEQVIVMYLGQIMEAGPSRHVIRQPSHPYTQALVSAIPSLVPAQPSKRIVLTGDVPSPLYPPPGCPFHTRCPVKIGMICETVQPPAYATAGGGWAACHLHAGKPIVPTIRAGE